MLRPDIYDDGFMQAVIYQDRFFEIETNLGTEYVPQELIGLTFNPTNKQLKQYIEGSEIYSFKVVDGWAAYLSAPGYMDKTDLTVLDNEKEAINFIINTYAD